MKFMSDAHGKELVLINNHLFLRQEMEALVSETYLQKGYDNFSIKPQRPEPIISDLFR